MFSQSCIQTYTTIPHELGNDFPLTAIFNDVTQKMIIANKMIAILTCGKVVDKNNSDGYSHNKSVSCVLYNHLFKVIVSTDLESCITVWSPWYGHRLSFISKAHSKLKFGEEIGVEITAACFDNTEQLLVTGARDGSIKLWEFNTGSCIREMVAKPNNEISGLVWYNGKILSVGWDRVITEFTETELGIHRKCWEVRHTDDITCLSIMNSQALVTASYNGELILWTLETGQPYRIYQAHNPTGRKVIDFRKEPAVKLETLSHNIITKSTRGTKFTKSVINVAKSIKTEETNVMRPVGISDALFLNSRSMGPNVGSLLVALESGLVQVWTHHPGAGFLVAFTAIHKYGDFVTCMTTDLQNEFLITGHKLGYIKVWLIKNYMVPNPPKINMCALRLEFPFLWKDRIDGRAKRAVKDQPLPLLLSSVGGHRNPINSIQFIPEARIIISGCSDHTIKLWTLGGQYISTLGTFKQWTPILPDIPAQIYLTNCNIPPDIQRSASFTTMKVLRGGERLRDDPDDDDDELIKKSDGERNPLIQLENSNFGKCNEFLSGSTGMSGDLIMNSYTGYGSLTASVYSYLKTDDLQPIEIPSPSFLEAINEVTPSS